MPDFGTSRLRVAAALPTVVALHCSASSPRQWASYAAALVGRAELKTPTFVGYDDNLPWSTHDELSLEMDAARTWLQLPADRETLDLVGHSYGAAVALAMARRSPQRVHSLTLYEPIPFGLLRHDDDDVPWREIRRLASDVAHWVRIGHPDRAAERFINYWGDASSWASMPQPRRDTVTLRMPRVCKEFDALFDDPTTVDGFRTLRIPVQVICGSESPLPARRTSQRVASLCPHATLRYLPGLGHMGPVERPDIVIPLLPHASRQRAYTPPLVSGL